jgi:HSP20 family molecular chaperone IbpA
LPEYFEVDWAGMEDGILSISLVRNIPEEKKPKQIAIS